MIFKIQLPITSSEDNPAALTYNEDRSYEGFLPIDDILFQLARGRLKFFVDGTLVDGTLVMNGEVEDPGW